MMSLWKIFRNLSAIAGFILLYLAASTSDYHLLELGVDEPSWVNKGVIVGLLMLLPMLFHIIYEMYMEGKEE